MSLDRMISAYVDWHEACRLVRDAYRSWALIASDNPRWLAAFLVPDREIGYA